MSKKRDFYEDALKEISKKNADVKKVFLFLEKSLKTGSSQAAYALGTWYLHGKHVKKNMTMALKLLRQAADGNVAEAFFDLAICYEKGIGVKKNIRLAMEYYLKASLYGDKQSVYEVGRCYYYGIGVNKNRRLAWIWLDRAKALGVES
jgi:hypothetical protein